MADIISTELNNTTYTSESFKTVIDTKISELYTIPTYKVSSIQELFNVYDIMKPNIPGTGSNSMQVFAIDVEENYSGSTIIYSPNNST